MISEYTILPCASLRVVRSCPGCGGKAAYVNTGKFRINANKKLVDVWLIYQCERCRHSWNMTIYERTGPADIPAPEWEGFLKNDTALAMRYGTDKAFFAKNRAQPDMGSLEWKCVRKDEAGEKQEDTEVETHLFDNPCGLKIRKEKILAAAFGISVSMAKKCLLDGSFVWEEERGGHRYSCRVKK